MKMNFKALLLISLSIFLASTPVYVLAAEHSGGGIYDPAFLRQNLIKGKTTIEEVRQKFGKATNVSRTYGDGGAQEQWVYEKSKQGARGLFGRAMAVGSGVLSFGNHVHVPGVSSAVGAGSSAVDDESSSQQIRRGVTGDNGESDTYDKVSIFFKNGVVSSYDLQ